MRWLFPILLVLPLSAGHASTAAQERSRLKLDYLEVAEAPAPSASRSPVEIEEASGGRLGVALVDAKGKVLIGFNRGERFAMCSTFKAPLAAAVLLFAEKGRFGLDGELSFSKDDLLDHAPVVRQHMDRRRLSISSLAQAAVEVSDNSAANILMPLVGGPEGLTQFFAAHGDRVSRLDRMEPDLNENAPHDPRDTTTPEAMAALMARLMFQDMKPESAARLKEWMTNSQTGLRRIRAGLPDGWSGGDKTGSCGTAFGDVAVLRSPRGAHYVLAVYLDRPTVSAQEAEAAIAEVTREALSLFDSKAIVAP